MLLHNPAKLPPIDRFEKLPKDAIYAAHARPLSESRQPESIRFTLDLPGMRCGIVNHSPDSPAQAGRGSYILTRPAAHSRQQFGRGPGIGGQAELDLHRLDR